MAPLQNGAKWASVLLAFVLALVGALAYVHGTFVTYREFTAAMSSLQAALLRERPFEAPGLMDEAWQHALKLAGASVGERTLRRPRVYLTGEKHFLPDESGVIRLCGKMRPYLAEPRLEASLIRGDVDIHVTPEELPLALGVATHEFLHYIWLVRANSDPAFARANPDDEAWVVSLIPLECPAQ